MHSLEARALLSLHTSRVRQSFVDFPLRNRLEWNSDRKNGLYLLLRSLNLGRVLRFAQNGVNVVFLHVCILTLIYFIN